MTDFSGFKEELRNLVDEITNADTRETLENAVDSLYLKLNANLWKLNGTGDCALIVNLAIKEIRKFWMHDATRADVCRWARTLICEMNLENA